MSFILISDMQGDCDISQSKYAQQNYEQVIATVEEKILKQLLGDDLYLKLMADLVNGIPQTQIYKDLVDGKDYQVANADGLTVYVDYKGIKPMLKYFIYAELIKHQDSENSEVGQIEPVNNNSQRMQKNQRNNIIQSAYNKGVELYGLDIENYCYSDAFIRGRRYNNTIKAAMKYDYWNEFLKGTCFNFLYLNRLTFLTWRFTPKSKMVFNGFL